jgi:pSer/pThr/pTyr-binding forkhead associated (FHA) protein
MADIPILVFTDGPLDGKRLRVPDGGLDIGRSDENHLVLTDEGVSRFHARLLYDNGSLWIQDAGSRNGVFVNDERLAGHRALKVEDRVVIACHTFEVRWDDKETSASATYVDEGDTTDDMDDSTTEETGPIRKGGRRWFWPFP